MSAPFRFVLISVLCHVKEEDFCDLPLGWNFLFSFLIHEVDLAGTDVNGTPANTTAGRTRELCGDG